MESKKSVVSSFDVDHLTLKEGLYLRSVYRINDTLAVHSWDMRFRAPMAHAPLGSATMNNVDAEQIRAALARVYKQVFPIKSKDDIVGLNERQCGNPGLYAVASTNEAMAQYMRCLYTREQAEEAGIGSIYNYEW